MTSLNYGGLGLGGATAASLALSFLALRFTKIVPARASTRKVDRGMMLALAQTSDIGGQSDGDNDSPLLHVRAVVTGSTSGLGKEIASELYLLGATVVLASRSSSKAQGILDEIKAEHPNAKGTLDCDCAVDTSSFESVRNFASWYDKKYKDIHILVNNAGIHYASIKPSPLSPKHMDKDTKSPEGYDTAFATNYLGHFLLTKLLLPKLIQTEKSTGAAGRIVNVSSSYHLQSDGSMLKSDEVGELIPLAARSDMKTHTHRNRSYSNNKLAQVLHAKALQKRLNLKEFGDTQLKVFSACPAWANTNILPKNEGGKFVASFAFSPKAAIMGIFGALFDNQRMGKFNQNLKGGEFVAVFQNEITHRFFAKPLMRVLTWLGVRDAATNVLGMYILFSQNRNYGYWNEPTSEEGENEELADSLYAWSDKVCIA